MLNTNFIPDTEIGRLYYNWNRFMYDLDINHIFTFNDPDYYEHRYDIAKSNTFFEEKLKPYLLSLGGRKECNPENENEYFIRVNGFVFSPFENIMPEVTADYSAFVRIIKNISLNKEIYDTPDYNMSPYVDIETGKDIEETNFYEIMNDYLSTKEDIIESFSNSSLDKESRDFLENY